jgi:Xaa-Pro dipeptidase
MERNELTPKDEIARRIGGLRSALAGAGIDFAVILQNVDMYYFTGTIQKGALVVSVDHDPMFFVEKSVERAVQETPLPVMPIKNNKEMRDRLAADGLLRGRGGMELDVIPVSVYERFKQSIGFDNFVDVAPLVKELRAIKSPFEIGQIQKSGRIMSHVFAKAKDVVREGMREIDVEAELVAVGKMYGHDGSLRMRGFNQEMTIITVVSGFTGGVSSPTDVSVGGMGVGPAFPQGSSLNRIERGLPVCIDYGGGYNGYVTDETRVFVIGALEEKFRKPLEVSRQIIEEVMVYARDGVDCTDVFRMAQGMARKRGLQEHFLGFGEGQVSFIGHGLGLEINEFPVITSRHSRILKEGMVFAFEPKFVFPGEGSVGIEVDLIVRKDGLERVSDTPLDLVCL